MNPLGWRSAAASVSRLAACVMLTIGAVASAVGTSKPAPATPAGAPAGTLTAEQIVARSMQAHGGLEAWRKLEGTFWKGRLESERLPQHSARFEITEKRPNKQRFEILDPAQKSLRVFDGSRGWVLRAGADGRPNLQQFSDAEIRYAREAPGLEGPIVDFVIKGRSFELVGREAVEGADCYRLGVRLGSGETQTVWVDAKTFLEVRYDRVTYGEDGPRGIISAYYRDYRVVEGLALPSVVEIGAQGGTKRDRMVIDQVALNPKIPDSAFGRPPGVPQSHEVVIRPTAPGVPGAHPPRPESPATPK
ncbi:MAG: hypothetical protein JSR73_15315 [Proteobacteria bacterium]|nr:hypothetical protein [Pseudomonadota bacterium]